MGTEWNAKLSNMAISLGLLVGFSMQISILLALLLLWQYNLFTLQDFQKHLFVCAKPLYGNANTVVYLLNSFTYVK